ncbi:hypothetical protein ACQKOD_02745 [Bacillus mycoides]|uniref:hypothetical protein n=1 Tax=Bacillus mycoides TaxID=1405 RepID=UPI003D0671DD
MKISEYLVRFNNLKLVIPKEHELFYERAKQCCSEEKWKEFDSCFGVSEQNSENGVSDFFMENVTTFSEISKYKGKLLVDMGEIEHTAAVKSIFEQLENFEVTPIAFEVKKEAVVLCWYVLPALKAFNDYGILLSDYLDEVRIDDFGRGEE